MFSPATAMQDPFWLVFIGSIPALVVAALAGLVIAILQGVMQINDQTLPQVVKTISTMVLLLLFWGMSFGPLYNLETRHPKGSVLSQNPILRSNAARIDTLKTFRS